MQQPNTVKPEKEFKQTEIGLIPEEWEVVKLGDAYEFSKKPKEIDIKKYSKIPFIPMEFIPDDEIYCKRYILKKSEEIRSGTFFLKGDLLLAKITPSFENGKQGIVNDLPLNFGYATTEVWTLHNTEKSDILYLFYYLKKEDVRREIASKMEGSTGRQRVPKNVIQNFLIPLPSLPEQKKIARVLSTIQEAKERTEAVIKAAKELKKSLMKYLFTYGPVPLNEAENVKLKETEIGLIPEEWEVAKLGDITKEKDGIKRGPWGGSIKKEFFVPHGYKVYEQKMLFLIILLLGIIL